MKNKTIKAWVVICSKAVGARAFTDKDKATAHKKFLNEEYRRVCSHKVYPCEIKYLDA